MVRIGKLVTKSLSMVALTVSSLLFMGCATSRGILEVPLIAGDNPLQGREVKIMRVTDRRTFQLNPPDPSIPSLKYGRSTTQPLLHEPSRENEVAMEWPWETSSCQKGKPWNS